MIRTHQLTRWFDGKLAVSNLDLEVKDGEVFGFIGPNGAGKTTTVRMLCCLIKPSGGRAFIDNFEIGKRDDNEKIRSIIGLLPELPGLYDPLTSYQILDFYGKLYRVVANKRERNIKRLLKMLGIWEKRNVIVGEFSKGMKQKVAICRALMHEPKFIFLDEPTAALDPLAAKTVRDFILDLKKSGKTIFITTHNLAEAEKMCDRVAIFNQRMVDVGTPTDLARQLFSRRTLVTLSGKSRDEWKSYPEAVKTITGVVDADLEGDILMVEVKDPEVQNPLIISKLISVGASINFVNEQERTLEDVYLKLMGTTIDDSGAAVDVKGGGG